MSSQTNYPTAADPITEAATTTEATTATEATATTMKAPAAIESDEHTQHIVVRFPAQGKSLPADHGYALYSALARRLPELHTARWLAIELISGIPWQQGIIALPTRHAAALHLRLPAAAFGKVIPLAGSRLDIDGHQLTLGLPTARPLTPAASLYARFVSIRNSTEPEPFLDAARRQLDALGIANTATLELPRDEQGRFRRRILKIKYATIVGFSLAAHNLSDDDSLKLQTHGLGGRRKMGCGIFNPIRQTAATIDKRQ